MARDDCPATWDAIRPLGRVEWFKGYPVGPSCGWYYQSIIVDDDAGMLGQLVITITGDREIFVKLESVRTERCR